MEKTKSKTRKKAGQAGSLDITTAYVNYLLVNGKRPPSVYKFCLDLGIPEDRFYSLAGSFEALEGVIWNDFIEKPIARLTADKEFGSFTIREKILAFYYALLEELKSNRSFVLLTLGGRSRLELVPAFMKPFKRTFTKFINELLANGKTSGEIASRPYLDKGYPQLFWLHMGFILLFWVKDTSPNFEQTDAAVEKSVNLAFDLIGKGAVDSAVDFIKFIYQSEFK